MEAREGLLSGLIQGRLGVCPKKLVAGRPKRFLGASSLAVLGSPHRGIEFRDSPAPMRQGNRIVGRHNVGCFMFPLGRRATLCPASVRLFTLH